MSFTPKHGDIFGLKDREHLALSMNGNIKTFSPNQWYPVLSGSIAKGVCVSIHNDGTSTGKLTITNADSMSRAVGLTLNATVNGKNEVQSTGLYNFDFDMFSTLDIGKPVYLGDGGALTTSKVDATSQSENIIELGIVVSQRSIFLDIEGDTRDGIVTTVKPLLAGEAIVTDGSPRLVSIGSDGKVYLADKRKDLNTSPEQRNHTFGFIIGATSGYPLTVPEDATVIVQTAGILKGDFGLSGSLGRTLFLHDNGTWTANSNAFNYHSDVYQPVGIAIEVGEIYVSISEPSQYNVYFPIGSVIAQGGATPDYGWLSCDGSEVSKITYADLYAVIGDVYGTPVDSNNFMLPPSTSVDQQIKFSNWYAEVPATAPVFRYDSGILPYNGSVPGSDLIIPTSTFGFDPPLSDMFAEVYITNGTITRRIDATIISNTYENIGLIKKEYQCQLYKDSANQVKIKIADDGFAYYNSVVTGGFSELPTDGSWTYRVYVYKTEKFNKFFDYTGDTKLQQMWDLGITNLVKAPTEQGVGMFDVGTTDPSSLASRLNYNGELHATQLHADVADGIPPLVVTSTTQVDNLNAGLLNNQTAGDIIVASTAVAVAGGRTNFIKNSLDSTDSGFWTRFGGGTALTYVPAGIVDISANGAHRLSTFTTGQYVDGIFKDVDGVHGGKAWEVSFGFYIPVGGTYTTNDLQVYVVTGTGLEILVASLQPLQGQIGFFKGWAYPPSNLDSLKLRIRCLGGSGDLYLGGFTVAPQIVAQYSSPNYSITTDESTTIGGNIKTVILKGATAITLTLEASVPIGHDIELQKVDSNANQLTLTASGGELIDGVASKSITVDLYTTTIIRKISATEWRVSSGLQDSELLTPVGTVEMFAGITAPYAWLLCQGQVVSRATYANLFSAITANKGTFTTTIATPGVVTLNGHGLSTGDCVSLTTTGALPTGLSPDTNYYVIWTTANTFSLATTYSNAIAGTAIATSGTQSGTHSMLHNPYGISGSTNFLIPDMRGASPAGAGTSTGYTTNETVSLGVKHNDQVQDHQHRINAGKGSHTHTQNAHTHIQDPHSHGAGNYWVSTTYNGVNQDYNSGTNATKIPLSNHASTATNQSTTATNNSNTLPQIDTDSLLTARTGTTTRGKVVGINFIIKAL